MRLKVVSPDFGRSLDLFVTEHTVEIIDGPPEAVQLFGRFLSYLNSERKQNVASELHNIAKRFGGMRGDDTFEVSAYVVNSLVVQPTLASILRERLEALLERAQKQEAEEEAVKQTKKVGTGVGVGSYDNDKGNINKKRCRMPFR